MRRLLALLLWVVSAAVFADELRPAYIQLDQLDDSSWELVWQASARSTIGRDGQVVLPENCNMISEPLVSMQADNVRRSAQINCEGSLAGKLIGLSGLEFTNTDALVRIAPLDHELITLRLSSDKTQTAIDYSTTGVISNVALTYTIIGVEHIVFGFDHLLFVLALVLLLKGWRPIAWAVTAFTVSHSITLVGTTLGIMALPQRPVEAIIALSIIFLAAEIIKSKPNQYRLSEQQPWLVAFLFGLLHGFGFAGALADIGLPKDDRVLALFSFNVGVELGQLAIVAIALIIIAGIRRVAPQTLRGINLALAYAIGTLATYWFVERLV